MHDHAQGIPQLVGKHGQELILGPARLLGLGPGTIRFLAGRALALQGLHGGRLGIDSRQTEAHVARDRLRQPALLGCEPPRVIEVQHELAQQAVLGDEGEKCQGPDALASERVTKGRHGWIGQHIIDEERGWAPGVALPGRVPVHGLAIVVGKTSPARETHDSGRVKDEHAGPIGSHGRLDRVERSLAHVLPVIGLTDPVGQSVERFEAAYAGMQPVSGITLFRHVAGDLGGPDDPPAGVVDGRHVDRDGEQPPLLVAALGLEMLRPLAPLHARQDLGLLAQTLRGNDEGDGLAYGLGGRVAEHGLRGRVPRGDDSLQSLADNGVLGAGYDGGQPRRILLDFRLVRDLAAEGMDLEALIRPVEHGQEGPTEPARLDPVRGKLAPR